MVLLEAIFHNMFCGSGGGGGKGGTASKVLEHVGSSSWIQAAGAPGGRIPMAPCLVHLLWFAEPRECREACLAG